MAGKLLAVLLLSVFASAQRSDNNDRVQNTASLFLSELGDLGLDLDRAFTRLTAPKVRVEDNIVARLIPPPSRQFLEDLFSGKLLQRRIGDSQDTRRMSPIGLLRSIILPGDLYGTNREESAMSPNEELNVDEAANIGKPLKKPRNQRYERTSTDGYRRSIHIPGDLYSTSDFTHRRGLDDPAIPSYEASTGNQAVNNQQMLDGLDDRRYRPLDFTHRRGMEDLEMPSYEELRVNQANNVRQPFKDARVTLRYKKKSPPLPRMSNIPVRIQGDRFSPLDFTHRRGMEDSYEELNVNQAVGVRQASNRWEDARFIGRYESTSPAGLRRYANMPEERDLYSNLDYSHGRDLEDPVTPSYEELNVNPLVKEYED